MEKLQPLKILDYQTQSKTLSRFIVELGKRRQPVEILEAGCGRQWPLNLDGTLYTLTGVDLDPHGLDARKNIKGDLHKAVIGDLRDIDLPSGRYDVIYSAYVLEHVEGAEKVLDNFVRWLTKDGIIVLMIPDRDTVWGFVARTTPYWFHVAFKRYVQRNANAGKPGFGPFPTVHDKIVSRRGIYEYCRRNSLQVKHEHAHVFQPKRLGSVIKGATKLIGWLSLGRLEWRYCDVILVLERQPVR